jgi:predicted alpha/beta superfamily hydrolase
MGINLRHTQSWKRITRIVRNFLALAGAAALVISPVGAAPDFPAAQNWQDIIIGKAFKFHSSILGEERYLLFYLPEDYETSNARYPVLYLLDGGGHFHHVSGIVQFMAKQKIAPPMILVGLVNTDRTRDLTPFKIERRPTSGGGDRFIEFLRREVFPLVEGQYRTQPHRTLIGHSLGGLFSVYSLLTAPDLFQAHIAISPAIGYGNGPIQETLESFFEERETYSRFLFITVGNEPSYLPHLEAFCATLEAEAPEDFRWKYTYMGDEDHASVTHRSVYAGLEFLYAGWRITQELIDGGLEKAEQHYKALSAWFGYEIPLPARIYNLFGYELVEAKNFPEAIRVFESCIRVHPDYWYAHSNLGYCHMVQGNTELARKHLEKALELNPEDTQAARRLEQLKKSS